MTGATIISLSDAAISLRILARETQKYGVPHLDAEGHALRQYIARHVGAAAAERGVDEGIRRLVHAIVFFRHKPNRPRDVLRAVLSDIGLVPGPLVAGIGMDDDRLLDDWVDVLPNLALANDYSIIARKVA